MKGPGASPVSFSFGSGTSLISGMAGGRLAFGPGSFASEDFVSASEKIGFKVFALAPSVRFEDCILNLQPTYRAARH
jgi:hypothetical protein